MVALRGRSKYLWNYIFVELVFKRWGGEINCGIMFSLNSSLREGEGASLRERCNYLRDYVFVELVFEERGRGRSEGKAQLPAELCFR